jgi:CRP-like cAMP-binding protein
MGTFPALRATMSDKTGYLGSILGQDPDALLALREVPAFHDCSGPLLELLFRYGKVVILQDGDELTREGEFDQWVFFVIKGRLEVWVGDQHVDTINSSMVGERCILGEQRRATLRATDEGVTALGVDMALLDALRDRAETEFEPISVYLELLSIITGEVINRIAELEFNLLDFTYKYVSHNRTERLSQILRDLAHGLYRKEREANFAIYRHLLKRNPVALFRCVEADGFTVDTRLLYAEAVLEGNHALLYQVAEAVQTAHEEAGNGGDNGAVEAAGEYNYAAFVAHIAQIILRQRGGSPGVAETQAITAGIHKRLRLDEGMKVDLRGLMHWLVAEHRFTAEDTIDLLMTLLKEASDYTARVNGRIKAMVHELTQTRFAKELESASLAGASSPAEYYHNTPLEELIPFFSKNILDVYLVQPYTERIHAAAIGTWDAQATHREAEREGLLTTLFE